jgi:hypothetical protein
MVPLAFSEGARSKSAAWLALGALLGGFALAAIAYRASASTATLSSCPTAMALGLASVSMNATVGGQGSVGG